MNILIDWLFWLIALFISTFALISFKDHDMHHWVSHLVIIVYYSIFVFSINRLIYLKKLKAQVFINKEIALSLFVLFSIAVIHYFNLIHVSSIWLDESTQAMNSIAQSDVVLSAAYQQQPPLFYNLVSLNLNTFGFSEVVLRSISLMATLGACLYLYFLLLELTASYAVSFSLSLFFLSNPYISWYAVEARPYALALFFFVCNLYYLHFYLKYENQKIDKLFISFLLFTLTINFQPIVYFLALAFTFLLSVKDKKKLKTIAICGLAFIILAPLFYKIISSTPSQYTKNIFKDFDLTQSFLNIYQYIKIALMTFGFKNSRVAYFSIFILIIIISAFCDLKSLLKNKFYYLLFLIYLFFNVTVFELAIHWTYQIRYSLLVVPLFVICLALSLNSIRVYFKKINLNYVFFVFAAAYLVQFNLYQNEKINYGNWRELYTQLDEKSLPQSVAYTLFINEQNSYELDGFIAHTFYSQNKIKFDEYGYDETNTPSSLIHIIRDLKVNLEPSEIYFVQNSIQSHFEFKKDFILENKLDYFKIYEFEVIKIKNETGFYNSVLNFYQALEKQSLKEYKYLNIYKALLHLYVFKKECEKAKPYYQILKKINQDRLLTFSDHFYFSECHINQL